MYNKHTTDIGGESYDLDMIETNNQLTNIKGACNYLNSTVKSASLSEESFCYNFFPVRGLDNKEKVNQTK